jgi:hypothetical protein
MGKKLFLTAKDLQRIENVSENTAYKYLSEIKTYFNKKRITLNDYFKYWHIEAPDTDEIIKLLN